MADPSHEHRRPHPQPMAAPYLEFDITRELEQLHREPGWNSGQNAKTLVKYEDLRIVLKLVLKSVALRPKQLADGAPGGHASEISRFEFDHKLPRDTRGQSLGDALPLNRRGDRLAQHSPRFGELVAPGHRRTPKVLEERRGPNDCSRLRHPDPTCMDGDREHILRGRRRCPQAVCSGPSAASRWDAPLVADTLFAKPIALFAALDSAALRAVRASSRIKALSAGSAYFREGDLASAFFVLESGPVMLTQLTPECHSPSAHGRRGYSSGRRSAASC